MERIISLLEQAGVPDRVSGIRSRVASMLVQACRERGEAAFREAVSQLLEAVVEEARHA